MLRINLLPPYIYDAAKRRNVMIIWAVVVVAVVAGFLFARVQLDAQARDIEAKTQAETADANQADKYKSDAAALDQQNAALKQRVEFVEGARKHVTGTYPPLLRNVRDWTIRRVVYSSVAPGGNAVNISAYAPSLGDVGHYLMAMQNNPKISLVNITMNSIPAFPRGATQQAGTGMFGGMQSSSSAYSQTTGRPGHDFQVVLTLLDQIPPGPVFPPGGGQGAGGGQGMGGAPGGMIMPGMTMPGMTAPTMGGPGGGGPMIGPGPGTMPGTPGGAGGAGAGLSMGGRRGSRVGAEAQ